MRQRLVDWMPAVTLLGALLSRGGTSLGFLAAFVILFPATLATVLVRWAPGGVAAREILAGAGVEPRGASPRPGATGPASAPR